MKRRNFLAALIGAPLAIKAALKAEPLVNQPVAKDYLTPWRVVSPKVGDLPSHLKVLMIELPKGLGPEHEVLRHITRNRFGPGDTVKARPYHVHQMDVVIFLGSDDLGTWARVLKNRLGDLDLLRGGDAMAAAIHGCRLSMDDMSRRLLHCDEYNIAAWPETARAVVRVYNLQRLG